MKFSHTKNLALPVGYRLLDYEIEQVLSSGGFSFVYLARNKEKELVAIKEFLPIGLALRLDGENVVVNSPEESNIFKFGLQCFFEEGLTLAKIEHKNIVRVTNFFRANGTVYMVMVYEQGKPFQQHIVESNGQLNEIFLRKVLLELLNGLREVHSQKLLHLDIKPANIYIRDEDNSPVLLDFGSARQTLTDTQAKLPPSYTPGFAAPEQYYDRKLLGPWSDIYSIGACLYSCLTRSSPVAANLRIKKDTLIPAEEIGRDIYSTSFLRIIDQAMALDYTWRLQSVYELQKAILDAPLGGIKIERKIEKPSLVDKLKNFMR